VAQNHGLFAAFQRSATFQSSRTSSTGRAGRLGALRGSDVLRSASRVMFLTDINVCKTERASGTNDARSSATGSVVAGSQ